MEYTPFYPEKLQKVYNLKDFSPINLDYSFLKKIGITNVPEHVVSKLESGSTKFRKLFQAGRLTSPLTYSVNTNQLNEPLQFHNYTGICPINVLEVNPSRGSCSISCLYCLVNDGDQREPIVVFENYPTLLKKGLEEHKSHDTFFYFSPKVDAFSEPLLTTGVTHNILKTFIEHFKNYPQSKSRVFIATKAGPKHLLYEHNGETALSLLTQLNTRLQHNGSIGMMPDYLHQTLEPNSASLEERLDALALCNKQGIYAKSILVQPIIPGYLSKETTVDFIDTIYRSGIINIKPEFLTINLENLALITQFVNHFDPQLVEPLLKLYLDKKNNNHLKQRERTAPSREWSKSNLEMISEIAKRKGISTSLCNWVSKETRVSEDLTKDSKSNGFCCLGYQQNIFSW